MRFSESPRSPSGDGFTHLRRQPSSCPAWLSICLGILFLLGSNQFLAPPDCASYWAWAVTPTTTLSLNFLDIYEALEMPVRYVSLTKTGLIGNDWPPGTGLILWPVAWAGPAMAHAWLILLLAGLAGAWATHLQRQGFSKTCVGVGIGAVILGTPVGFYGSIAPFFSHTASFLAVGVFVLYWDQTRDRRRPVGWFWLGLVLGVAACIRPQNIFLGLLLGMDLLRMFRRGPFGNLLGPISRSSGGVVLGLLPVLVVWTFLYGSPLALPKMEEMRWMQPALVQTLLSDFHGILPWTPIHVVAALGLLLLGRRDPILALGLGLVAFTQLYINAANEVWWAGGSFGNRRFSDYAIVVAYGVAAALQAFPRRSWVNLLILSLIVFCCVWTTILFLMERQGLLPLDRYIPWNQHFWGSVLQFLQQPWEIFPVMTQPLWQNIRAALGTPEPVDGWRATAVPQSGIWPLALRLMAAWVLVWGIPRAWKLGAHLRIWVRSWRSAAIVACLWAGVALVLLGSGSCTPQARTIAPELADRLPSQSLILWDNMLELALYELVRGRPDRGLIASERAVRLRPDAHQGWWYRAASLRKMGRWEEARRSASKTLELDPDHRLAKELLLQSPTFP